jgi:hypothetical protein
MGSTDAQATVSHGHHNAQFRPGQFQTCPIGQGPSMEPMESVGVEKRVKESGTSNIADHRHLMAFKTYALESLVKGAGDALMGATRAKNRRPIGVQQTIHGSQTP